MLAATACVGDLEWIDFQSAQRRKEAIRDGTADTRRLAEQTHTLSELLRLVDQIGRSSLGQ